MTDVLMQAGARGDIEPTVLRLPMVWGPGDPQFQHRHGDIIWHLLDGEHRMILGASEQGTIWTFGYVENVAAAVIHAMSHEATSNAIFNVGETTVRTKRRWADLYATSAGVEFEYEIVPDELLDDVDPNRPTYHIITDNSRFERDTGFRPPVTLEAGIARTYSWAGEHRDEIQGRPDFESRQVAAVRYADLIKARS